MSEPNHTTSVEYREISRFVGYRFGDDGTVWSRWRQAGRPRGYVPDAAWRLLTPVVIISSRGYRHRSVKFRDRTYRVHRLILEAFVGPCPSGMQCRHLDGDSLNNRLDNLCWGTQKENADDAARHGVRAIGERVGRAKLTPGLIRTIRFAYKQGWSQQKIADRIGISQMNVSYVIRAKTWKHIK